jgi:hypothetical protein
MTKNKYEQQRDANVQNIRDVFKSFGIDLLASEVSAAFTKKQKGKAKAVDTGKPESDTEYDPGSEIDNQSESDDDLANEVGQFHTCTAYNYLIYLILCCLTNHMDVCLGR